MDKQELTEELIHSIRSKKMLEVVNIGAVKVGSEFIILKKRPNYEFSSDGLIEYAEHHSMGYEYKELIAKNVIFDTNLFGLRGKRAINKYLHAKEG